MSSRASRDDDDDTTALHELPPSYGGQDDMIDCIIAFWPEFACVWTEALYTHSLILVFVKSKRVFSGCCEAAPPLHWHQRARACYLILSIHHL